MKWVILVIGFGVTDADSYFKSVTYLGSCDWVVVIVWVPDLYLYDISLVFFCFCLVITGCEFMIYFMLDMGWNLELRWCGVRVMGLYIEICEFALF